MDGKPTVLVVEGRPWVRDSIARWLDDVGMGVMVCPAFELMWAYGNLGKPLVLLRGPSDPVVPFPDDRTRVLRRPPTRSELLAAVEAVIPADAAATSEEA